MFADLSAEARILFVIGEPLRRQPELSFDSWTAQTFRLWSECTGLDFEAFRKAFGELSKWVKSK